MENPNSNRSYALRNCKNPNCDFGGTFIPHWFTQIFCCNQCRINYWNDQRRIKAGGSHRDEKLLRICDNILGAIKQKASRANLIINESLLRYEGIEMSLSVSQNTNKETGNQIRWFYRFGLEFLPEKKQFVIHEANKKK